MTQCLFLARLRGHRVGRERNSRNAYQDLYETMFDLDFCLLLGSTLFSRERDTVESDAITTHLSMERNTWDENDVSVAIQ